MAQLTDDCFAFSGPLLRLDDMERLIGERIAPVAETERVRACGRARPRARGRRHRAGRACRRSTIPPSMAMRCATPISKPTPKRG